MTRNLMATKVTKIVCASIAYKYLPFQILETVLITSLHSVSTYHTERVYVSHSVFFP